MKFDLQSPPPSAGEIEAERLRLEAKKRQAIGVERVCLALIAVLAVGAVGLVVMLPLGMVQWPIFVVILLLFVLATQMLKAFDPDPVRASLAVLAPLSEAARERGPEILGYCRQDGLCEAYRLAVARLDRPLTIAEADMIVKRVLGAAARKAREAREREQEIACRLLGSKEPQAEEDER